MSDATSGLLPALREKARKGLRFQLNFMFANAEQTLLGWARKATRNAEQNLYFDAMRELRLRSQPLEQQFLERVLRGFDLLGTAPIAQESRPQGPGPQQLPTLDFDEMSLVQDDDLEESLAIDTIAGRAEHQHLGMLMRLRAHMAMQLGARRLDPAMDPLSPKALLTAFIETCKTIEIDPGLKMVFSRLFRRLFLDEIGPFYEQCLAVFPPEEEEGAAPTGVPENSAEPPDAGPLLPADPGEEVATEARPQKADLPWDIARTPLLAPAGKAPAMPRALLDEVLMTLQQQLLDRKKMLPALNPKGGIRPLPVYELLNDVLVSLGHTRALAVTHDFAETINLVTLLFEHALADTQVPQPIRRLIRLLEIPVLRAAIRDPEVLTLTAHPVRRFMHELGAASIGWSPAGDVVTDEFYRKMQGLVARVISEFDQEFGIFDDLLANLRDYLRAEEDHSRLVERRTLNAEMGRAQAAAAREEIAKLIGERLATVSLPIPVVDFLRGSWSDALFVLRLRKGAPGVDWENALQSTDRLIACARSDDRAGDFAAASDGVRAGLRCLGLGEAAIADVLEMLCKAIQGEAGRAAPLAPVERARTPKRSASPHYLGLVDKLAPDTWVEFRRPGHDAVRARLLTKIPASGQFLFVNRAGAKAGEWSREELALAVENGSAVLLNIPGKGSPGTSPPRWGRI